MTSPFALPDRLAAKADPALIADDERHFAAIAASLEASIADLSARLEETLKAEGGSGQYDGQHAADRDRDIHRLTNRLQTLRRYGLDLCLGKAVDNAGDTVYIGRIGLTDGQGRRLLVDWRSPAAEPFFGATHGDPMGLESRRRYRWTGDRITDYWDEVFTADGFTGHAAALDDQSAFIASLGTERSDRMRDVLGTIQADQDAIIRAGSGGALVVDGGPGTGKTVVALHRAAYLLYSDPRLGHHRGDVLVVGPSEPYLAYVSDVLPSLGEEGVQTCTLRDLVPGGADAAAETDPEVARLKASADLVRAIEPAARRYEQPPKRGLRVETNWGDVYLSAADWADAFAAAESGIAHNEARDQVWQELAEIVLAKLPDDADVSEDLLRRSLARNRELLAAFDKAWPVIEPADLVAAFWASPEFLAWCAPHLSDDEVQRLQRKDPFAWTASDLPLLDAARRRLGDPEASRNARRREAEIASEREVIDKVVEDLLEAGDGNVEEMILLKGLDLQDALVHYEDLETAAPDLLAGPFAHVVVDEAQELTDAEWQMLLQRCPSRSFTIVGDRAQARHGFTESWTERLERVGMGRIDISSLSINYRTPEEVMAEAERVIREALPDANVPTSVRRSGIPVTHGPLADLDAILEEWLAAHADGTACVIGAADFTPPPRVRSLTPELSKGLEFDLVVLVNPDGFGTGIEGAVDRYVGMTRATGRLAVLTS
ncbi:RNA polymerase recycling motor ATPase HelR [Glycomyces artemisiae]|uniref:DNA helicase IV n=1 Tax=Glycomyces artemisiae TaxID=1076443 RepID=A0A2T0UAF6_9ACTN|nr:RNA polymerase recycling motor ATPase HelR [Glycomyces artemisiae]PRY54913.1 DNA helicase IV [Glycomyces artemisiae]